LLIFVARRLLLSIPVLIVVSFVIFTFVSLAGDPLAELRIQPKISQETIQSIIEAKHLDDPIPVRYAYWVQDALFNSFGSGLLTDAPIWPDLKRVLGNTLQLILLSSALAVILAIGIGVISAVRQYSLFDYAATTFSFVGFSTPVFWLALILQVLVTNLYLATGYRLFYTAGLNSPEYTNFFLDRLQHLVLPVIVLSVTSIASWGRYVRASMLEVLHSDYIRTARAKGVSERSVVLRHALRSGLIPLVTVVAVDFGALFGGAIVTETIFSLDGMGLYFIHALNDRDVYPIMAWLMVTGIMVVAFNLIADIIYGYLDPRIRRG
jgi:peptide/nickel transport system permease protein